MSTRREAQHSRNRVFRTRLTVIMATLGIALWSALETSRLSAAEPGKLTAAEVKELLDVERGIVAVLDVADGGAEQVVTLASESGLTIYFQSADSGQVEAVRQAAAAAGLLGRQIVAHQGSPDAIHLADNVADGVLVSPSANGQAVESELLRVLRPRAAALIGERRLVKPVPAGIDEWTHPYHGPDNNPQSTDQLARGAFRTQFLAEPKFSPMPEQSVVAGGRIYKAMGHIAHKTNQNEMLNTLLCINAYNGTILWKRPLSPGFMLHRNTMVATDDALYMGDHESCKVIDGQTGEVRREITVPEELTDGPVWKWMALRNGVLYALVGNPEVQVDTITSDRRGLGHWPWGMWQGHDYKDPRTSFGFGRTLVAIEIETGKLLWHYRDEEFLDARAVCMNSQHIYCLSGERFLACLDAATGSLLWKNADKDLLEAIGPNGRAQHYVTGYATTCYMKCTDRFLFFAGPQRTQMVVASAETGKLAWTHPDGNLQLVLRDDAIYAAGPQSTGVRLDYETGSTLGTLPARRACTRATGCADSIFFRTTGGTVRVLTETNAQHHIAPMRPPCQDGVIISNGLLYWGPWMCGCQLSLYGHIALGPAPEAGSRDAGDALVVGENIRDVPALLVQTGDWTSYRGDNARSDVTRLSIPAGVRLDWQATVSPNALPTAPVAAGGMVFIADRNGAVSAFDQEGQLAWKTCTGGPIYFPPAIAHDRVYVGSADGRVYALAARGGQVLWSYRVAPEERLIPVFGNLISTWPVAGGVVVDNDSVYAAAGIAHYDGTHVVRLDAITGEPLAANRDSGALAAEVNGGVSMQGELSIVDGELQFLGGGVYEIARYDLQTLRCLNSPQVQVTSQYRTAFYPYYPEYGKYLSLEHTCADGSTLCHNASYEGSVFTNLALEAPLPAGVTRPKKEASNWSQRRGNPPVEVWRDNSNRRFTSFVVSRDQLLAAGHPDNAPEQAFLGAINLKDGTDAWIEKLPAVAVKGGVAFDAQRRIYVATEDGQLLCYAPAE
jgi:outer membrane protein assembly factor BamB